MNDLELAGMAFGLLCAAVIAGALVFGAFAVFYRRWSSKPSRSELRANLALDLMEAGEGGSSHPYAPVWPFPPEGSIPANTGQQSG